MKTIAVTLYKFAELSEEAKEKAINDYRNSNTDFDFKDLWDSKKEAEKFYNDLHNIEGEISGARLYTWIQNNFSHHWTRPVVYSKHTDGTFKKSDWQYKYDCIKSRRSRIQTISNLDNCFMTGMCYDIDFMQPIIDFLKKPDKYTTNLDLVVPDGEDIAQAEIDYQNSDEAIIETIEANDYDFTAEGELY